MALDSENARLVRWTLIATLALGSLSACYNAAELRAKAEATPDPRQKQVDHLWGAIGEVVAEEGWPVELDRRQDLLLATSWMEAQEGRRKRVRFLLLMAPTGVGVNVTVKYQKPAQGSEGSEWIAEDDPEVLGAARREERELVQRVYALYKDRS